MNEVSSGTTHSIPEVCARCGTAHNISKHLVKKVWTPQWVYWGYLFGLVPGIILALIARKKHKVRLFFCADCWRRFRMRKTVDSVSGVSAFIILMGGGMISLAYESWIPVLIGVGLAVSVAILAQRYDRRANLQYLVLDRTNFVIDIPGYGVVPVMKLPEDITL